MFDIWEPPSIFQQLGNRLLLPTTNPHCQISQLLFKLLQGADQAQSLGGKLSSDFVKCSFEEALSTYCLIFHKADLKIGRFKKEIPHHWMNALQEVPNKSLVALPVVNLRFSKPLEQTNEAKGMRFVNRCVRVAVLRRTPLGIRTPERNKLAKLGDAIAISNLKLWMTDSLTHTGWQG